MMRRLVLLTLVLLSASNALALSRYSGYYTVWNNYAYFTTPQAACSAAGWTWFAPNAQCSNPRGCCLTGTGGIAGVGIQATTCSYDLIISSSGRYSCDVTPVNSCGGSSTPLAGTLPSEITEGLTCTSVACTAPQVASYQTLGNVSCSAPPCLAGATFVGVGADTASKCLGGCSFAISAPAVYGEVTAGVAGVHSRWVGAGATCTAPDELVAADVSGCPSEVSPVMASAICGIPPPCEEGKFLFSGECVADSAETGCVIIDGEQVCAEAEQNCVVINGKRICAEVPVDAGDLETYKDNGCVWSFAQGAWVCPTDTATKTTSGTTTTTTDPVTGEKTTTTVTTIRNNVTGGTTTTTTTVVTDPDGNEISRDVSEETTGQGGEGGTLVAREPEALGERPDLDWLKTEEEVMQTWSDRWEAAPIVAAVSSFSGLSLSSIEGTCPEFCLPLWGETLCTTKHCEIWETVSFIISGVLLALYGMTAMRIVLSA